MAEGHRRLIWGITLVMIALIGIDLVLFAFNLPAAQPGKDLALRIIVPGVVAAFVVLGALLVSRVPSNPIGWILWAVGGLTGVVQILLTEYSETALRVGGLPGAATAGWLGRNLGSVATATIVYIVLLFPDGRLPTPRWRPAAIASGIMLAILAILQLINPAPLTGPVVILAVIPALTALSGIIIKYRRAGPERKQQIKWLAYAAVIVVLAAFSLPTVFPLLPPNLQQQPWVLFGFVSFSAGSISLLPIAITIAILRYRLYDIDLVINRTVAYGALAAVITVIYVAIVVGIGSLIGNGRSNVLLSLAAAALVAVAFQPLRARAQLFANRLVYGNRASPYEVLSRFSERIAQTIASDETLQQMAVVLAEATRARRAEVWLHTGNLLQCAALYPTAAEMPAPIAMTTDDMPPIPGADAIVPVTYQGELLGALVVEKRTGEALAPIEDKLLRDLAREAGLALKNVGLAADLRQRLEELRSSRERLVTAQDAERRRLERNIHDGAQQNLVALKVKLGLARHLLEKDPARLPDLIRQLDADADETLSTIRDLARGIYPPLLADQGLVTALQPQARRSPIPVSLRADGTGRYRPDIEAATYFCCLEALQNAAKYSQASEIHIRLSQQDGRLVFVVEDNGRGYDASQTQPGSGLQNMVDRVEALGGKLEISSSLGAGTRVAGRLPAMPAVASTAG